MRVGVVQFRPVFGDIIGNVERMLELVSQARADLFVLPELALSGYIFASRDEAHSLAQLAEKAGEKLYNAALLIAPDGARTVYRKVQLFADEKRIFDPGDRPPRPVEVAGARLGMMICFDWIFPEVARTLALAGTDILCHSANLVLPYCQDAMITRCIENRVFALTANRIGTERRAGQELTFTGRSQVISPRGEILARADVDSEEVLVAELDLSLARDKNITERNHLLTDRRPDVYRLD
jgi:predicted amidohydrolase